MSEIHPAPGQEIAEIYTELEALGFRPDREYWVHYTWDLRPFVQTTSEAFEAWEKRVADRAGTAPAAQEPEPETPEPETPEETSDEAESETKQTQAAKKAPRQANRKR